jgi:hypothetical protein
MFGFFELHQPSVWSTSDKNATITPSGLSITGGGGGSNSFVSARSSVPLAPNQKIYFELTVTATAGNSAIGVMNNTTSTASYPGSDSHGIGIFATTPAFYNGTQISDSGLVLATGNIVQVAVDGTTQMVWIAVNGGTWNPATVTSKGVEFGGFGVASFSAMPVMTTSTGTPAAGTGGINAPLAFTYPIYITFSSSSATTETMSLNAGSTPFAYTPPLGFRAPNSCNTNVPNVPHG